MTPQKYGMLIALLALVLAACAQPTPVPTPTPQPPTATPSDQAAPTQPPQDDSWQKVQDGWCFARGYLGRLSAVRVLQ